MSSDRQQVMTRTFDTTSISDSMRALLDNFSYVAPDEIIKKESDIVYVMSPAWEKTVVNMINTYRKLKGESEGLPWINTAPFLDKVATLAHPFGFRIEMVVGDNYDTLPLAMAPYNALHLSAGNTLYVPGVAIENPGKELPMKSTFFGARPEQNDLERLTVTLAGSYHIKHDSQ